MPLRITIYGAGAIGAHLGGLLARAGQAEVSFVARGPHMAAMRENGLRMEMADGETFTVRPRVTDDPAELGPQDHVIVTLKAHQAPGVVERLQPLLGPGTAVVTCMNGVPWWYFHGLDGEFAGRTLAGRTLESVDPGGAQWHGIGPERAIGCVVYPAAEITAPGVCRHIEGDTYVLGEPDGSRSDRVNALSKAMIAGGLRAPVKTRIRDEIWMKLLGNLSFNPISALTHATLEQIGTDPDTKALVQAMMREGQQIGEALGARFLIPIERRIQGAVKVGAHKTSMLQDLERGRPMEIDALVSAVAELGDACGIETPFIDAVAALVKQRARIAGLYPTG